MVSQDFIDAEQTAERRPAELYHLWQTGISNKYFTSGDVAVVYNGNTYVPATIKRGNFTQTSNTEEAKVSINFAGLDDPLSEYIDQSVVSVVWIKIMKIHRDISPVEINTRFVGRIKNVIFKGETSAKVMASGIKGLFKKQVPKYRYQPTCNHPLFSTACTLDKTDFDYQGIVSVLSSDGLYFESDDIYALMVTDGIDTDNWCRFGYVEFGNYKRMITRHDGNAFSLRYRLPTLEVSDTVTVYAGCDKLKTTCYNKFDNILHFLGFAEIPFDNPVTTLIP